MNKKTIFSLLCVGLAAFFQFLFEVVEAFEPDVLARLVDGHRIDVEAFGQVGHIHRDHFGGVIENIFDGDMALFREVLQIDIF